MSFASHKGLWEMIEVFPIYRCGRRFLWQEVFVAS